MERSTNFIEEELKVSREILIDNDSEELEEVRSISCNLQQTPSAEVETAEEQYIDFVDYIQEKCENRIQILNRATFHAIQRPIIIAFNHFREKCYYHTKWLDRLYELSKTYGDHIELIAADQIDMDLIYQHTNPIDYFCFMVRPEDESANIYAIDAKKRIYEHFDAYKSVENLTELCENLLNGSLYKSQPMPNENDGLVKICVLQNYDELVTNSRKDILLIVDFDDYGRQEDYEPDYEQIAETVKDWNVDIVYINGDQNYVPFEFHANSYPTILFIPHNDKEHFIHYYKGPRDTANVLDFIQENTGDEGVSLRHTKLLELQYKPFTLPSNMDLNLKELQQYIVDNFPKSFKVLDRTTFNTTKECSLIYFMDFNGSTVEFHAETLKKIHQVAQSKYYFGINYLIADHQDIDIMYPKWYRKYIKDLEIATIKPQVYAIDPEKHFYKVEEFKTASSLFYYSFKLRNNEVFHSQHWTTIKKSNSSDRVITCIGHNLLKCIRNSNTDIFLTLYESRSKESQVILNVLQEIADEARSMYVKLIKMDVSLNYVPLEYCYSTYPVHFFIPYSNRDEKTIRYQSVQHTSEEILQFIRCHVQSRQ